MGANTSRSAGAGADVEEGATRDALYDVSHVGFGVLVEALSKLGTVLRSEPTRLSAEELEMLPKPWAQLMDAMSDMTRVSPLTDIIAKSVSHADAGGIYSHAGGRDVSSKPDEKRLHQFATKEDWKEMAAEPLEGAWLDPATRMRWGLDRLFPGDEIMYTKAFKKEHLTHHGVYLGFIRKDDYVPPNLRVLMDRTTKALRGVDDAVSSSKQAEDEVTLRRQVQRGLVRGGGGSGRGGVDLVVDVTINPSNKKMNIAISALKWFAQAPALLGGNGYVVRDLDSDISTTDQFGRPVWLWRVMASLGVIKYRIRIFNCEHFATFVTTGVWRSEQAEKTEEVIQDKLQAYGLSPHAILPLLFLKPTAYMKRRQARAVPKTRQILTARDLMLVDNQPVYNMV